MILINIKKSKIMVCEKAYDYVDRKKHSFKSAFLFIFIYRNVYEIII